MKDGKRRKRAIRYHAVNLLQTVEIPEHAAIKRILRLGEIQEKLDYRCRDPRPTLMMLANPRNRHRVLASSNRIKMITSCETTIEPCPAYINKITATAVVRGSSGFDTAPLQVLKPQIHKLGERGRLIDNLCSGAAGELRGRAHLWPQILDQNSGTTVS